MVFKCRQCGEQFELTDKQIDYYKAKGLEIPVLCRDWRRIERIRYDAVIPRGRVRRNKRKHILRAVPPAVLMLMILGAYISISFSRSGPSEKNRQPVAGQQTTDNVQEAVLFRNQKLLREHYEKHGKEMGYHSEEEYLAGANAVINDSSSLHKQEKENGDDIYYRESENRLVIVSTDGYIRTYFRPEDGIRYYEKK